MSEADQGVPTRNRLEEAQVRWEMDKLDAKRRLVEEVIQLVQHDKAVNAGVTRVVESMAKVAELDPSTFWRDRSPSITAEGRFQLPLFPPFPFPFPFPTGGVPLPPLPFPFPPPPPPPWDVFGQAIDLIKAEKAMIQDLVSKLLG